MEIFYFACYPMKFLDSGLLKNRAYTKIVITWNPGLEVMHIENKETRHILFTSIILCHKNQYKLESLSTPLKKNKVVRLRLKFTKTWLAAMRIPFANYWRQHRPRVYWHTTGIWFNWQTMLSNAITLRFFIFFLMLLLNKTNRLWGVHV